LVPKYRRRAVDDVTALLTDARTGDRVALAAFVRATQSEVWRLARHLVGPDDADEVTQDTYVRAWKALPSFRGDASARTWLLAIARRACADAVRQHARRRRLHTRVAGEPTVVEAADAAAIGVDLLELVDGLAAGRREAFVLTQVLGCSYDEAARIAGVPVGTIRSRVARARETLLEALRAADAI
jgi:RNA polymerase sigma-70 factor (ECF subfamily)